MLHGFSEVSAVNEGGIKNIHALDDDDDDEGLLTASRIYRAQYQACERNRISKR